MIDPWNLPTNGWSLAPAFSLYGAALATDAVKKTNAPISNKRIAIVEG
ncbi:MAG: hypothetical protein H7315_03535 [Herminiimonas sp.]|nr:hypothetical protein [Herminiimonas sp.]